MRIDLRIAGLDETTAQRVRLACGLIAAHDYEVNPSTWDGTRCDVVVVDDGDAEGRRVAEIAARRGTPALYIGSGAPGEPAECMNRTGCTAAAIAARLHAIVVGLERLRTGARQRPTTLTASEKPSRAELSSPLNSLKNAHLGAALVQLASAPHLQGVDVDARVRGRTIRLRPSVGRVHSHTLSDLLAARNLLAEDGWQLDPISISRSCIDCGEVSASLDAFYVSGALHSMLILPPFPAGSYSLRDWPDLGSAPEAITALRVAQLLRKASAPSQALASISGLPAVEVNAYFWAFGASNLLLTNDSESLPPPPAPARKLTPLLARLAGKFGLSW